MTQRVPTDCPNATALREMRERLGLSQSELASELGFAKRGPDVIRDWEHGAITPTPLAWRAFRLMYLVSLAIEMGSRAGLDPRGAVEFLRENVSEALL